VYTSPLLSSYILSAIVAALLATNVFDSPLSLVSAVQFPRHPLQASAEPAFSKVTATTNVNRSRKSDRLPVIRADPVTNTTIILKNVGAPVHIVRSASGTAVQPRTLEINDGKRAPTLTPAPQRHCEGLASPYADPILSRFIGRCFV